MSDAEINIMKQKHGKKNKPFLIPSSAAESEYVVDIILGKLLSVHDK